MNRKKRGYHLAIIQKKIKNIDQFQKSLIDKYELEIRNLKIENKNYNQKIKDEIVKEVNIHFSKKKKN